MSVFYTAHKFSFVKQIATGTGDTELVAAPGAGKKLVIQSLMVTITTAAAQTFNIEDDGGSAVVLFAAPASLAVGTYGVDCGPLGVPVTANTALQYDCGAAGVGATISGWGYILQA